MYELVKKKLRSRIDNYEYKTEEQRVLYDAMHEAGIAKLLQLGYSELVIYKALTIFKVCNLTNPRFLEYLKKNQA